MTAFFLIISLILNIFALMAIVILYLRQNKLLQVEGNQKKMMKETEELITSFLLEMKDENEQFIQRVKDVQIAKKVPSNDDEEQRSSLQEAKIYNDIEVDKEKNRIPMDFSARLDKAVSFQAVKTYQQQTQKKREKVELPVLESEENRKPFPKVKNDISLIEKQRDEYSKAFYQNSFLEQVMMMNKEGLSGEEIAKRLNKGKTEIALLLKFRENQQE